MQTPETYHKEKISGKYFLSDKSDVIILVSIWNIMAPGTSHLVIQ